MLLAVVHHHSFPSPFCCPAPSANANYTPALSPISSPLSCIQLPLPLPLTVVAVARIRYVTSAYVSIRQHTSAYVSIRQLALPLPLAAVAVAFDAVASDAFRSPRPYEPRTTCQRCTRCTRFTSTKVRILTQEAPSVYGARTLVLSLPTAL